MRGANSVLSVSDTESEERLLYRSTDGHAGPVDGLSTCAPTAQLPILNNTTRISRASFLCS